MAFKFQSMASVLLFFGVLMAILDPTGAQIGVCYGVQGNNLPSPRDVVSLLNRNNIKRVRIYDLRYDVLDAFRGSNIEVIIGVPNSFLQTFANSQGEADSWVQNYIQNYIANVRFRYIAVGNELKPGMFESQFLVPAMIKIQNSIYGAGLGNQIKVSSAIEMGSLANSYPPSAGVFRQDYLPILNPLIDFLNRNGSPLLVNHFPFYSVGPNVPLEFALFTYPGVRFTDGPYEYRNVFDATLDALYVALEKIGFNHNSNSGSHETVITESGWENGGAGHKSIDNARIGNNNGAVASVDNARTYVNNLIQHVKNGTPRRPGPLETYIFSLFDENLKYGDEQNWGMFSHDGQPNYPVNFN